MSSHIPQIKKPERPSGDTRVHQNQFVPILDQASKAYSTRRFSMIMSSTVSYTHLTLPTILLV